MFGHWLQWYHIMHVCILKCFSRLLFTEKVYGHWLQDCSFSPKCTLNVYSTCFLLNNYLDIDYRGIFSNILTHCYQLRKPSDITFILRIWFLNCFFILLYSEKAIVHWSQGYDFISVCILKCFFRLLYSEKALVHWLQGYRFWPMCVLIWHFK